MQPSFTGPCVILRHTMPAGDWHLDCLLSPHPTPAPNSPETQHRDIPTFRFDQPDANILLDLLLNQQPAPAQRTAKRTAQTNLAPLHPHQLHALRLPYHRRHYLVHEGPLRDDTTHLGRVQRVAVGHCNVTQTNQENWIINLHLTPTPPTDQPTSIHTRWSITAAPPTNKKDTTNPTQPQPQLHIWTQLPINE